MSRRRESERAGVPIARKLVSEIRRRRLRPGTQLDAEHRMVDELGVARAAVQVKTMSGGEQTSGAIMAPVQEPAEPPCYWLGSGPSTLELHPARVRRCGPRA